MACAPLPLFRANPFWGDCAHGRVVVRYARPRLIQRNAVGPAGCNKAGAYIVCAGRRSGIGDRTRLLGGACSSCAVRRRSRRAIRRGNQNGGRAISDTTRAAQNRGARCGDIRGFVGGRWAGDFLTHIAAPRNRSWSREVFPHASFNGLPVQANIAGSASNAPPKLLEINQEGS